MSQQVRRTGKRLEAGRRAMRLVWRVLVAVVLGMASAWTVGAAHEAAPQHTVGSGYEGLGTWLGRDGAMPASTQAVTSGDMQAHVLVRGAPTDAPTDAAPTAATSADGSGSSAAAQGSSPQPTPPAASTPASTPPLPPHPPMATPTPPPGGNAHPPIRDVPHIVYIGDSLTGGNFATTQAQDYVSLVTSYLGATALDTQGHYGWTVQNTINALQTNPAPSGADLVVVELGTNDVGASTSLADFSTQYAELISMLKQDEPTAYRWVCLGTWRDPAQDGSLPPGASYDAIIQADCPGQFVSLGSLYMNFSLHGPQGRATWLGTGDWFHPNDAGHQAIAAAVEQALTS